MSLRTCLIPRCQHYVFIYSHSNGTILIVKLSLLVLEWTHIRPVIVFYEKKNFLFVFIPIYVTMARFMWIADHCNVLSEENFYLDVQGCR